MLCNAKGNLYYLVISFKELEVSRLLDTGARKTFISRKLIPSRYAAADMLQIWLPNGEEVQSKGKVTLKANIEKLQVTFDACIPNIT